MAFAIADGRGGRRRFVFLPADGSLSDDSVLSLVDGFGVLEDRCWVSLLSSLILPSPCPLSSLVSLSVVSFFRLVIRISSSANRFRVGCDDSLVQRPRLHRSTATPESRLGSRRPATGAACRWSAAAASRPAASPSACALRRSSSMRSFTPATRVERLMHGRRSPLAASWAELRSHFQMVLFPRQLHRLRTAACISSGVGRSVIYMSPTKSDALASVGRGSGSGPNSTPGSTPRALR